MSGDGAVIDLVRSVTGRALDEPMAFAAGIVLLVAGPWLIRAAGKALLAGLAVAAAAAAVRWLAGAGLFVPGAAASTGMYVLAAGAGVLASRHPVVARNAEFVFLGTLGLFAGGRLAAWLHWPPALLWGMLAAAAVLWRPGVAALFAAAVLSAALGATTAAQSAAVLAAASALCLVQHGLGPRRYWDDALDDGGRWSRRRRWGRWAGRLRCDARRDRSGDDVGRAAPVTAAAHDGYYGADAGGSAGAKLVPVIFRCGGKANQARLERKLARKGISCERFLEGSAYARVPGSLLRWWRHSTIASAFCIVPDFVYHAENRVTVTPVVPEDHKASAAATDLESVARALRADATRRLPGGVATGRGRVVAVLDTGVNACTPRLRAAVVARVSVVDGEGPDDYVGHGTSVAECVAAAAPDARIVSIKCLDKSGRGSLYTVLRALTVVATEYAAGGDGGGLRVDVLNLSLGGPGCRGGGRELDPLCRALAHLTRLGFASACAIGNSGPGAGTVECPGSSAGTLGVGAVDMQGLPAAWSSRGPCADASRLKPDVACYGDALLLPDAHGAPRSISGTSFAAPLVAGSLAVLRELVGDDVSDPGAMVDRLYAAARGSALPAATDDRCAVGQGVFNLCSAAHALRVGVGVSAAAVDARRRPRHRPARAWRELAATGRRSALAAAAAAAVVACVWNFGLAQADELAAGHGGRGRVLMLGRVHASGGGNPAGDDLVLDDGTGRAAVRWTGPDASRPRVGSIVLLVAEDRPPGSPERRCRGLYRFQLTPADDVTPPPPRREVRR